MHIYTLTYGLSLTSCVKINIIFVHTDHVASGGKGWFISVRGVDIHHLQRNLQRQIRGKRLCLTLNAFFSCCHWEPSQYFLTLSRCYKPESYDPHILYILYTVCRVSWSQLCQRFVDTTILSPKQRSTRPQNLQKATTISNRYYKTLTALPV